MATRGEFHNATKVLDIAKPQLRACWMFHVVTSLICDSPKKQTEDTREVFLDILLETVSTYEKPIFSEQISPPIRGR